MKTKILLAIFMVVVMVLSLCSCGKSKDVKAAEDAINAIGEVNVNSEQSIIKAEKLYGLLTDVEKSNVENRLVLIEAREAYDKLKKQMVEEKASSAYKKIQIVADMCINGMDDIYGAWYWGIYKSRDVSYIELVFSSLSQETPSLSSSDLKEAADSLGYSSYLVKSNWQYALWTTETAQKNRGDYDKVRNYLSEAQSIIQEISRIDSNEYSVKLKNYYSSVSAYADFFLSPSGNFSQLADTISEFEQSIKKAESDIGVLIK